jgi:phospholipase C
LIISPFAKHGFVDHALSEHSSTLKLIETVFHVPSLGTRDANPKIGDLTEAFNLGQVPRHAMVMPGAFIPNHYPLKYPNGTILGPPPSGLPGTLVSNNSTPDLEYAGLLIMTVSALVVFLGAVTLARRVQKAPPESAPG